MMFRDGMPPGSDKSYESHAGRSCAASGCERAAGVSLFRGAGGPQNPAAANPLGMSPGDPTSSLEPYTGKVGSVSNRTGVDPSITINKDKEKNCEIWITKCLWINKDASKKLGCSDQSIKSIEKKLHDATAKWATIVCPCPPGTHGKGCTIHVEFKFPEAGKKTKKNPEGKPDNCSELVIHCNDPSAGNPGTPTDPNNPKGKMGWTHGKDTGSTSPLIMEVTDDISQATIEHEIGHSVGIMGDNYVKETYQPKDPKFEGWMMGDPGNDRHEVMPEEACILLRSLRGEGGNPSGTGKSGHGDKNLCNDQVCCQADPGSPAHPGPTKKDSPSDSTPPGSPVAGVTDDNPPPADPRGLFPTTPDDERFAKKEDSQSSATLSTGEATSLSVVGNNYYPPGFSFECMGGELACSPELVARKNRNDENCDCSC